MVTVPRGLVQQQPVPHLAIWPRMVGQVNGVESVVQVEGRDFLQREGMRAVRHHFIGGKGTGALRETVHAVLRRTSGIESFGLAPGNAGGWGATIAALTKDG